MSSRTLRLRKDVLTDLDAGELRSLGAGNASLNTCLHDNCVTRLVSAAIQTCFTFKCLSGEPSCPC